jgi:hypothetical protein
MAQYQVLSHITLSETGPVVTKTATHKNPQLIHLKQGSLDGACGPYCLCMALIILGLEKYTKLSNLRHSDSSEKLFSLISDYSSALITEGTHIKVMKKYTDIYKERGLVAESKSATLHGNSQLAKDGKKKKYNDVRNFVVKHVKDDRPVILGSAYHYALVIGLGYENRIPAPKNISLDDEYPRYLLLLDPDEPAPVYSAWNGVIDMGVKGNHWFGTGGFTFEDALALWREN